MVERKHLSFFVFITLLVLVFDQATKLFIILLKPALDFPLLKIHMVTNTGAGFGILQGRTILLAIISLVVASFVVASYPKLPQEKLPQFLFAVFLGGVLGNMLDRFFRSYVVDFIDFGFWPAFNIADTAITLAVAGLLFYYWKK